MMRALIHCAAVAMCVALAAPAQAHRDRILPISADGAIEDIPPQFGRVKLTMAGLEEPGRSYQSVVEFLFNLHDATLIDAKSFEVDQSGRGGQYSKIDLTSDCVSKSGGRINTL